MRIVAVLLILLGVVGLAMGGMMFGDIGVAAMIGAAAALLSGIGFFLAARVIDSVGQ